VNIGLNRTGGLNAVITMLQTRRTIRAAAVASGYIASIIFTDLPVDAQPPQYGLKTGYVATLFTGEVLPGQLDNLTVRNILDFPGQFSPAAMVIALEHNYRSTQPILFGECRHGPRQ